LEVLLRIARAKYIETGRATGIDEAYNMLLECVVKNYEVRPWQEFRQDTLWCWRTDQIFKANDEAIKKVYDILFPRFEPRSLAACIELFCEGSSIALSVKEIRFCYGMSKMTVRDEIVNLEEY
jgi:hypothetical protein